MSPYGAIARPATGKSLSSVLPRHAVLRPSSARSNGASNGDQSYATTLFKISGSDSLEDISRDPKGPLFILDGDSRHSSLVKAMHEIFNEEVERGDTYPQESISTLEQFEAYFFSGDSFVLLRGNYSTAEEVEPKASSQDWNHDLLGFFYVKPNFPGRCSHICNGGFVVNPTHRGLGVGGILAKAFLKVVPIIGFKASMFNLVFESNTASIRLWRRLGFKEIGRVPKAGRLRGQGAVGENGEKGEGYVDAIQFYWDFESMPIPACVDEA